MKKLLLRLPLLIPGFMVFGFAQAESTSLKNSTILIIRHAEKPEEGDGLTPAGEKRAAAYVDYFKGYKVDGKPLKLSHLFAATDSKKSKRPRLTIEPLSKATGLKIDTRFTDKANEDLIKDLKAHSYGSQILISWRHGKIADLVKDLGGDAKALVPEGKWPDEVFDRVIELHFDANGKFDAKKSKLVKEHLFPTDEK